MRRVTRAAALLSVPFVVSSLVTASDTPQAEAQAVGSIREDVAPSGDAGVEIDYAVYLPPGYDDSDETYPSIYLLHGRGDTMAAWQQIKTDLDELINSGTIPPVIAVMPDAPWSERGNYYVDSAYAGDDKPQGVAVETAMTVDLVSHVDATYRTVPDRAARAVGGYSMGGYGALRYTLAHQDLFAAGLVLSPAVYVPEPPADSSAREFGAFGLGKNLYKKKIYESLNYPTLLPQLDTSLPVHLFVAVGDDEWMNPDPTDADHDLDFEAARVYNQVRRSPAVTAELRVLNGGHSWDVWRPAFREGILDTMAYLRTAPPTPLTGELAGTPGDDRAGGITVADNGDVVHAINAAGPLYGAGHAGGLDALVVRRTADGEPVWVRPLATSANDRAYGVETGPSGETYVAGYTRGNLSGTRPDLSSDDAFVARLSDAGDIDWAVQFGDANAADRVYATAAGDTFLVGGYTSGSIDGTPNAGDKDAFVANVSPSGELTWTLQLGGAGEDKTLAVAEGSAGEIYAAGVTSAAMPGNAPNGGLDGWVARVSSSGELEWLQQVGTADPEHLTALVADPAGGVVAAGYTGGTLGGTSSGDNDALVVALNADGSTRWITQEGSSGDDRAAALAWRDDGSLVVAGHTSGRITVSAGGVDVFALALDATGTASGAAQLGTPFRDGADEWDEANLYLETAESGGVWMTGLTEGSTTTHTNQGLGDVFWTLLAEPAQS